jgi:hypothetical protein
LDFRRITFFDTANHVENLNNISVFGQIIRGEEHPRVRFVTDVVAEAVFNF